MIDYAADLEKTVRSATSRYRKVSDADAAKRPAPDKWSAKEIIGHLIDSASNNHQRFVRANFQDDLIFVGYKQNEWVEVQRYNDAPWSELLDLWLAFNLQLARVIDAVPADVRMRAHVKHNLDQLAFANVDPNALTTLDFFMRDYVDHLHHHLRQVERLSLPGLTRA